MIGGESLALVGIGVAAGLGAAWEAGPAVRSLLYGVTPSNGTALAAAGGFVLLISALATMIPAARASRIEPASALRNEG
jgi:ABC-type antimicrobial peptide transport system permease subunit